MKSVSLQEIREQQRRTARTLYEAGFSYESVCGKCGKTKPYNQEEFAECLVHGFPQCCELTMALRTQEKKSA